MAGTSDIPVAHAWLEGDLLVVGNALLERQWRLDGADLYATRLTDRAHGREWVTDQRDASLTRTPISPTGPSTLRTERVVVDITGAPALQADLVTPTEHGDLVRRFLVFDDFAAIGQQLINPGLDTGLVDTGLIAQGADDTGPNSPQAAGLSATATGLSATGLETADAPGTDQGAAADVIDALTFDPLHCRLVTTRFVDQTDHHHDLLFEHEWSLHPSEKRITAEGNLWYLEHRPSRCGLALVKIAPGPEHRFVSPVTDLVITGDQLTTYGHGGNLEGYRQWTVAYRGDRSDRTAAIQGLQLQLRPPVPGRDGVAVSNTWGDRSQDSRMTEDFLLQEIAAAEGLGIDTVQLDDGWQKGVTANAWNRPQDGAWGDYWSIDPDFWTPRPSGLPRGLDPLIASAGRAGLDVGLWFSPDSSAEFAQWERDRDCLTELITHHGITQVKLDGVLLTSPLAERRFRQLITALLQNTDGRLTFDLDVTAQVRLGYWGALHAGPLFVENRYTDFGNYWPHQTLRTLWRLSHHIHPVRLRMEFLNPYRNTDRYPDDPLAPDRYRPATLFATVMMASPLAWFELSEAPAEFRVEIAELIMIWKRHRDHIHSSVVLPIGDEPDGYSWTGFCTAPGTGDAYAVVFRPVGADSSWTFSLPRTDLSQVEWLHGEGSARVVPGGVEVDIDQPLGHAFVRIS